MKKSILVISLAVLTIICLLLGRCYSDMLRQENTVEVWRNLSFITYPEAKAYFENKGVDVNSRGTDGQTFLMVASQFGMQDTARIMLDLGADVNAKDDKGQTALQLAQHSNQHELVRLLLKHGARKTAAK